LEQISEALAAGTITQEQADLLVAHINERAAEGVFGYKGTQEDCVLGDEALGIFRNANTGQKAGQGFGVSANEGTGFKRGGNTNAAKGANGQGFQDGSCIVE
ncbi:MAG: hypothetical protein JXR88_04800, partial [Clostridia bacterium]|nr:hypothetical protein [Clostridia bacterium]